MADWNPFDHHRGPFRLAVMRSAPPARGRKYPAAFETLGGLTTGEDAEAEARALLADPRDTIEAVYVWSEPENRHVTTFRKETKR